MAGVEDGGMSRSIVGMGIGIDRIWAVSAVGRRGEKQVWTRTIDAAATADGAGMREALSELRESVGAATTELHIALLPPLAEVRRLELPRLRDDELRRVIVRDAVRHFQGVHELQVIGVAARANDGRGHVLAAAAPAALVQLLHVAAADSGWHVRSIVAAHDAWRAAAAAAGVREGALIVATSSRMDVLLISRGRLALVRRFPLSRMQDCVAAVAQTLQQLPESIAAPRVLLAGSPPYTAVITTELIAAGVPDDLIVNSPMLSHPAGELAARYAAGADGVELVPEQVRGARTRRSRRLAARLAGAAALMVASAAGIEAWGIQRELHAVQKRRAQLEAAVSTAAAARTSALDLRDQVAWAASVEQGAPRWSARVADIALQIPDNAYLIAVRAEGDTITIEGAAAVATEVFDAFRHMEGTAGVRALAPVRRDLRDGQPPVERFTFAVQLANPAVDERP